MSANRTARNFWCPVQHKHSEPFSRRLFDRQTSKASASCLALCRHLLYGGYDHHLYVGPLTLSQLICLLAAGISILLLLLWRRFVRNDILD